MMLNKNELSTFSFIILGF